MNTDKILKEFSEDYLYGKIDTKKFMDDMGKEKWIEFFLGNLGNPNSLIRENVCNLINPDCLTDEECIHIINVCLGDTHLFNGLGTKDNDTVFWRSFPSLTIGYLIGIDTERNFLSQEQYLLALDKAIQYMKTEVDRRGFIKGKGWAHAVSHGADMIAYFVKNPKFPMERKECVLESIKVHLLSGEKFVDGDEKRLSAIIISLLEKGMSETVLKEWLESLIPRVTATIYTDEYYEESSSRSTLINFVLAIHFTLSDSETNNDLRKFLKEYDASFWSKMKSD